LQTLLGQAHEAARGGSTVSERQPLWNERGQKLQQRRRPPSSPSPHSVQRPSRFAAVGAARWCTAEMSDFAATGFNSGFDQTSQERCFQF
jgi:hypothetical protein